MLIDAELPASQIPWLAALIQDQPVIAVTFPDSVLLEARLMGAQKVES